MQERKLKNSIAIRYGLIMAIIIGLSMAGMLSSVLIAESLDKDAAKINLAGSMRMQSYKISQSLILSHIPEYEFSDISNSLNQIEKFEHKLTNPTLSRLKHSSNSLPIRSAYKKINKHWKTIKISIELAHSSKEIISVQQQIDSFVDDIDNLVLQLQLASEGKIRLLRIVQGIILFSTLITAFLALYNLSSNVVEPLRTMIRAANSIRQGNFDECINYNIDDELGVLAKSINEMAGSLSELYENLEGKVREKTIDLEASNRALSLLYQASLALTEDSRNANKIQNILVDLEKTLSGVHLSICLTTQDSNLAFQINNQLNNFREVNCFTHDCNSCLSQQTGEDFSTAIFPISKGPNNFGELFAKHSSSENLDDWQIFILKNMAEILAASFSLAEKSEQEHYLALMEERAVIARELHDSLAQSLSYLKMQTARLEKLKQKQQPEEQQLNAIQDIRTGLNDAYRQLRELLTTFRLEIKETGLKPALQGTVAEFSEKSQIPITLDFHLDHVPLKPNEEIHVLQIIREALSNINRHSKAQQASVNIHQNSDNSIHVIIRDDGVGLTTAAAGSHYGTSIMNERAASLNGKLNILNTPPHGVSVELNFTPSFLQKQDNNKKAENYEPLKYFKNTLN